MRNQLENPIQGQTRLLAAQMGLLLMRNNSGAYQDVNGRWVRYGLMNDSKKVNEEIKSSDLIGVTPVFITPEMVGTVLGVFTAVESKKEGWHLIPSDKRGHAQAKFHDIVRQHGGFAGFVSHPSQLLGVIRR